MPSHPSSMPTLPPAQIPPHVSAPTADDNSRDLVKGSSPSDQAGNIYGIEVLGTCCTYTSSVLTRIVDC